MSKKFICIMLIFMFLLLQFMVACSKDESNTNTGDNNATTKNEDNENNDSSQETSKENLRLEVPDDLPDMDYGGDKYAILYIDWSSYQLYQFADEEIGEVMNDAIYYRQKNVEDRFNIQIAPIKINFGEITRYLSTSIRAGSNDYDLALTHCVDELTGLMTKNYLLDWNTIPTLNFSKPWWNKDAVETMSVAGKLYLTMSDFIIPEPNAVFFNKKMIQEYELEDPYGLVRKGKWTIDKMYEMAKKVAKDLDGDGEWTNRDQYGVVTQFDWYFQSLAQSAGMKCVIKDENGRFAINADIGKMQSILEKYDRLLNDKTITFTFPYNAADQYVSLLPLSSGQVLFHFDPLPQAIRYRGDEVDYGILPWPKYDENQEKYVNFSWNGFMAMPSDVPDLEKAGIIIEALSAESYKYCVPAFYDVLMNVKLTRDEDSVEMLDIIYSSCVYDLDLNYAIFIGGLRDLLQKGSTNYVSEYERNADIAQGKLDKIFDQIEDND